MPRFIFCVCLLLSTVAMFAQEPKQPKVSAVTELPPESIPVGTCKESYSGYLEVTDHGKAKDINLTSQQVGDYIKKRLSEGYSLSLYLQASGRLFVFEICQSKKD
jgi:hypothetical protein